MIAEVLVRGNLKQSSSNGFRSIADFIFGNNIASSGKAEKISMTAPVVMKPKSEILGEHINEWLMHFVMPSDYTNLTIPKPKNPNVKLRSIEKRRWLH